MCDVKPNTSALPLAFLAHSTGSHTGRWVSCTLLHRKGPHPTLAKSSCDIDMLQKVPGIRCAEVTSWGLQASAGKTNSPAAIGARKSYVFAAQDPSCPCHQHHSALSTAAMSDRRVRAQAALAWEVTGLGSRVTALHVEEESQEVYVGLDAPRDASGPNSRGSVVRLSLLDGSITGKFLGGPARPRAIRVAHGTVAALGGARELAESAESKPARPSRRQCFGEATSGDASPQSRVSSADTETPSVAVSVTQGQDPPGPEYIRSPGFRGPREGYVFMHGVHGPGYYLRSVAASLMVGASQRDSDASAASAPAPPACHAAAFLPGSGRVAFASLGTDDTAAEVWDARERRLVSRLAGHTGAVLSLGASSDGSLLATGSYDGTVRVWDAETGDEHLCLRAHRGGVRGVAFLPTCDRLLSTGADNEVREWDLALRVCLRSLEGRHSDPAFPVCLAVCEDGTLMATGSNGPFVTSTVIVRSVQGSHAMCTLHHFGPEGKGEVSAVVFAGMSGTTLLTGGSDGTVRAWVIKTEAPRQAKGMKRGFL